MKIMASLLISMTLSSPITTIPAYTFDNNIVTDYTGGQWYLGEIPKGNNVLITYEGDFDLIAYTVVL